MREAAAPVQLVNLTKSFGRGQALTPVLRGVSLNLGASGLVALVGPSGCGKTTLLNLVGGLDRPDSGSIVINGVDISQLRRRALNAFRRKHLGFIFQFFNLLPTLTALENVMVALDILPMPKGERLRRARHYLEAVGLADHANRFPSELSGGQQQRVSVARALAKEPTLLLADEPTGNLDQASGQAVFSLIRELQARLGILCVFVTHDQELALRADQVVRMVDGQIVEEEGKATHSAVAFAGAARA